MNVYVGIGGGSDIFSARLIGESTGEESNLYININRPLFSSGEFDALNTVRKYTGLPFTYAGISQPAIGEYVDYVEVSEFPGLFYKSHTRHDMFALCFFSRTSSRHSDSVRVFTEFLKNHPDHKLVAVDTGGDCLRGLIPGMGNRDIANLFDGTPDTRDEDTLHLLQQLQSKQPLELFVLGPGADGETSSEGLEVAHRFIQEHAAVIRRGNMNDLFVDMHRIPEWKTPKEGSIIANITNAMNANPNDLIDIKRRGVVVGRAPAGIMRQFWVFKLPLDLKDSSYHLGVLHVP